MGEIVDLDAFRKQREEEEKAKAEEEERIKAEEEQAEIDYMNDVLTRLLKGLGGLFSGSMITHTVDDSTIYEDFTPYYTHEAGYTEDGYYENSWDYDMNPIGSDDDEEDI